MIRILVLIFMLITSSVYADYVVYYPETEEGNCDAISYGSPSQPSKYGTYTDNWLQTVRRITDKDTDGMGRIDIQYSTFTCSNMNHTNLAFNNGTGTGRVFVDPTTGNPTNRTFSNHALSGGGSLDVSTDGDCEFRWSRTDSDVGYFDWDAGFYQYTYSTDTVTELFDVTDIFPTALRLSNNDKGEQGFTSDQYWAFRVSLPGDSTGDGNVVTYIMILDKDNTSNYWYISVNDHYQTYTPGDPDSNCRWVTMSPSGDYLIAMFNTIDDGGGPGGVHLFERGSGTSLDFVSIILNSQGGHPAWGYDVNNREVAVFDFNAPIRMYHLDTDFGSGNVTELLHRSNDCPDCGTGTQAGAYHLATSPAVPGWALWSSYNSYDDSGQTLWYEKEMMLIKLTTVAADRVVIRVGNNRSIYVNYIDMSMAVFDSTGDNIYFDSGWWDSGGGANSDVYRIELPENWENLAESITVRGVTMTGGSLQ